MKDFLKELRSLLDKELGKKLSYRVQKAEGGYSKRAVCGNLPDRGS